MNRARIQDWHLRADELRIVAETIKEPKARRSILDAAASYDAMAAIEPPVRQPTTPARR
jgi:hypothetical protein